MPMASGGQMVMMNGVPTYTGQPMVMNQPMMMNQPLVGSGGMVYPVGYTPGGPAMMSQPMMGGQMMSGQVMSGQMISGPVTTQQGVMMPRKSTSFGPKPAGGLVMRSLDLG